MLEVLKTTYSVQSFLRWKGFSPGPIDGKWGPLTTAAWNSFLDYEEDKAEKQSPPKPAGVVGPIQPTAQPVLPSDDDRARCDNYTKAFTFPSECAFLRYSHERIPEDVTWENVPGDSGGVTKWGIDQRSHPSLDIKNLSESDALNIYYQEWTQQGCHLLPSKIAECVHDTFTTGGHPIIWLQQVLGVKTDGQIGPETLAATKSSDLANISLAFLAKRDAYFNSLADTVGHDAQFRKGWLNRDKNLRKYLGLV